MHDRWHAHIPLYVAGSLPADQCALLEGHLTTCAACRAAVVEWQAVADAVNDAVLARSHALPPLSPVVQAQLHRRPTLSQAVRSGLGLVWAQRVLALRSGILPIVGLILALAGLVAFLLEDRSLVTLPLLVLVPIIAALSVALLHGPDTDSAFEIVSATPTSSQTLVFARLTFVLGWLSIAAILSSWILSLSTSSPLLSLVGVWLGPMLLLAALATILALIWRPLVASGVTLTLWVCVVLLLSAELRGYPAVMVSLQPLLEPTWSLVSSQIALAVLLWGCGWVLLAREAVSWHAGEGEA